MKIQPVILSGGSGTRLWPLSREYYPKQLLALQGELSLLQETIKRLDGLDQSAAGPVSLAAALIICNEEHRFLVAEQARQAGIELHGIMLEPCGRNTAPALTLAAESILAGDDAVMLVMPADHLIKDTAAFHQAIRSGYQLAIQDYLVTFGIVPGHAETGYGYIRTGEPITDIAAAAEFSPYTIAAFVEKPDADTAQAYLDSGEYLWNSGMFMMKASVWRQAIGQFRADILAACQQAVQQGARDQDFFRVDKAAFAACPSDSIDYAVMEKLSQENSALSTQHSVLFKAAVIPLDAGWSDIGSWSALWDASDADAQGNVTHGDVYAIETTNSLLLSEYRLLAAVGIDNMVVVETADAVLVAHKDQAQQVKQVVERIKQDQRSEHQIHRRVHRPWGCYEGVDAGERFQVKRITVSPGSALSLQMHHHRAEHWIVVKGTARVTRGDDTFLLSENESTYIPIGVTHRLENPGNLPLEIIEVQSGSYLGEDDIVRLEDVYNRK
jgi:mannose-1-phosphate guanylyltransferase/mannose-6-phosphate isomerase